MRDDRLENIIKFIFLIGGVILAVILVARMSA
jgi:hypothetical protein